MYISGKDAQASFFRVLAVPQREVETDEEGEALEHELQVGYEGIVF